MPGHIDVLLAEANMPYEQLKEMDDRGRQPILRRRIPTARAPGTREPRRCAEPLLLVHYAIRALMTKAADTAESILTGSPSYEL